MVKKGLEAYREKVRRGEVVRKKVNRPSMVKAIKAKCKDCMCDYVDGRNDCEIEGCSLYYWQPYGKLRRARMQEKIRK